MEDPTPQESKKVSIYHFECNSEQHNNKWSIKEESAIRIEYTWSSLIKGACNLINFWKRYFCFDISLLEKQLSTKTIFLGFSFCFSKIKNI